MTEIHHNQPGGPGTRQGSLLLDRPVPEFCARSTQGTVSLADYRGQWLILFAHPADFTPVCTSEFIAL
jgi:peroxiredoxin (alkyl hydroperoxide reductase subunit C)